MKLILKKSGGIFDIGNLKNEISELEKRHLRRTSGIRITVRKY